MPAYPTFYVYVQTTIECVKYVFAGPDMTKKDAETLAVEQARVDGHIVKSVTSLVY